MTAADLINPLIPSVKIQDATGQVLDMMQDTRISQLPLISQDNAFIGLVDENLLMSLDEGTLMGSLPVHSAVSYIHGHKHIYDALYLMSENNTQVVAVLDNEDKYIGAVRMRNIAEHLAGSYALRHSGGIIELSVEPRSYSLAEISRLVEADDAKILNVWTDIGTDNHPMLNVTIKINQTDLTRTIATFERFGYTVTGSYHQSELNNSDLERLDFLMKIIDL